MDRRDFLQSGGTMLAGLLSGVKSFASSVQPAPATEFNWSTVFLRFSFALSAGRLRQRRCILVGVTVEKESSASQGVEVALQCTGENSPAPGLKSAVGQPGTRLQFKKKRIESTESGQRLIVPHVHTIERCVKYPKSCRRTDHSNLTLVLASWVRGTTALARHNPRRQRWLWNATDAAPTVLHRERGDRIIC